MIARRGQINNTLTSLEDARQTVQISTMTAPPIRSWRTTRESKEYLISTSSPLLSHDFIQTAFATKEMYWAKPLPAADLALVLSSSLNLGLYVVKHPSTSSHLPPPRTISEPSTPREGSPTVSVHDEDEVEEELEQIGFARFITDHVTTFYLTDVFVSAEYRGMGIGKWLIACCGEIMCEAKHMRRSMLMATPGQGEKFYEQELGMYDIRKEEHAVCMTKRFFGQSESDLKET